ncbi:MAG TPA: alpha/beta hydrolase [Stellaceae bacterium]|nr:alpha/beta hydrolase [Stellaceae bacterium]
MPANELRHTCINRRSFLAGTATSAAAMATKAIAADISGAQLFPPEFRREKIELKDASINTVIGGKGPPLLLLHGYPQTHVMWHKIAPQLGNDFTLVIPDLRGYGDSSKPPEGENHVAYSKRVMAQDQIDVMAKLGFTKFAMVAHDRGARVGHRLALDHPDSLSKLALMDILPTLYLYRTAGEKFARAYWHWFFLIRPAPFPETLIGSNVEFFLKSGIGQLVPKAITPEAYAEYLRCFRDPAAIHGACEDYRAAATIDLTHDEADLDKKVQCPLLVLWGEKGFLGPNYDFLALWRNRAVNVTGKGIAGGHFFPEEAPEPTLAEVRRFLLS